MRNLNVLLGLAAALALLGVPSQAADSSGLASQLAMAAKAGGFSTLTQATSLGLTTDQGGDRFQKGWLSKALPRMSAQAAVMGSSLQTPEGPSATGSILKNEGEGLEKSVAPRQKRVSSLQDPGEAMYGSKEKRLRDDAEKMRAQEAVARSADAE